MQIKIKLADGTVLAEFGRGAQKPQSLPITVRGQQYAEVDLTSSPRKFTRTDGASASGRVLVGLRRGRPAAFTCEFGEELNRLNALLCTALQVVEVMTLPPDSCGSRLRRCGAAPAGAPISC